MSATTEVKKVPAQPKWTKEKAAKAAAEGKYMKIEGKSNNELLLSGAVKMWAKQHEYAYVFTYRIAGPLVVRNAAGQETMPLFFYLKEHVKLTDAEAAQAIQGQSYTFQSVVGTAPAPYNLDQLNGPLAANFRAELQQLQALKQAKPSVKKGPTFSLAQINDLAKNCKESNGVTVEKKARAKKAESGSSSSAAPATGRTKPMLERVLKLGDEKVFDVSGFASKGSSGCKPINTPKGPNSKKYSVDLRITDPATKVPVKKTVVSNDEGSLRLVLDLIFPGDAASVTAYVAAWNQAKGTAVAAATVKPAVSTVPVPVLPVANGVSHGNGIPVFPTNVTSPTMTMGAMYQAAK